MSDSTPSISIALLVRNGMPNLASLLQSLQRQRDVGPLEIVAIDSGSSDGSVEAMQAANVIVHSIDVADFSFGPTRQLAFSKTHGEIIVTLSQDTLPTSDGWLAAMIEPILKNAAQIVSSPEIAPTDVQLRLNVFNVTDPYKHWPPEYAAISCAGLAITRAAWEQTGFGDGVMSEDKFLALHASRLGLKAAIATGVALKHGHPYSAKSLAKRAFNEGVGTRNTDGRYFLRQMMRDILRPANHQRAIAAVLKHRVMKPWEAAAFPLRPLFLYLGARFGRRYWR